MRTDPRILLPLGRPSGSRRGTNRQSIHAGFPEWGTPKSGYTGRARETARADLPTKLEVQLPFIPGLFGALLMLPIRYTAMVLRHRLWRSCEFYVSSALGPSLFR